MKEVGTASWNIPNTEATNTSLFSALPGGYRYGNGNYSIIGNYGLWWSSSEGDTGGAWSRALHYNAGDAVRGNYGEESGFSVRCLRD